MSNVGYEVTITRAEWYTTLDGGTEWCVEVLRLGDGAKTQRTFATRWGARRFGRSTRRIGRAFEKDARWRKGEYEKYTLGWADQSASTTQEGSSDA